MRGPHVSRYLAAVSLTALALGIVLAGYSNTARVGRFADHAAALPWWKAWAALGVGIALGMALAIPQRRQLRRHRDFVAAQLVPGRRRGWGIEFKWLRVLAPMLAALLAALLLSWWLRWPALIMVLGVFGMPLMVWRETRSTETLAKRIVSGGIGNP